MIYGLVLAGGRSSRFGREKAMAELNGRPFIAHVLAALASGCQRLAVNARAGDQAAVFAEHQDLPCLQDAPGDPAGPLAGVRAGLIWAQAGGAEWLATAPCDTPFLPPDLVRKLAGTGGGRPAVVQTAEGVQPLCAMWPVSALPQISAALALGRHPPIKTVLQNLKAEAISFEAAAFQNLNTPLDYSAALQRASTS